MLSVGKGKTNLSRKDKPMHAGLETPTLRLEDEKEKEKKIGESDLGETGKRK